MATPVHRLREPGSAHTRQQHTYHFSEVDHDTVILAETFSRVLRHSHVVLVHCH